MKTEEIKNLIDTFFGYMEEYLSKTSVFTTEEQKAGNDVIRPHIMCPFAYYDAITWNCLKSFGRIEGVSAENASLLFRMTVKNGIEGEDTSDMVRIINSIITKSIESKFGKMYEFNIADDSAKIYGYKELAPNIDFLRDSGSLSFMPNPNITLIMMDKIGKMFRSQMNMYFQGGMIYYSTNETKNNGLPVFGYDSVIEMFHNMIDDNIAVSVIPAILESCVKYSPVCCSKIRNIGAPLSVNSTLFNSFEGAFDFIMRVVIEEDNRERLLETCDEFMDIERSKRMSQASMSMINDKNNIPS